MMWRNQLSLAALTAVLSLSLAGCAWFGGKDKSTMRSTDEAPAAMGVIESERTDDGNTRYQVQIENLAAPHRVVEGTRLYVVWLKPLNTGESAQNVGTVMPGEDLKARIDGITPYSNFELFVTAEPSRTPNAPSDNRVLSGFVRRGA